MRRLAIVLVATAAMFWGCDDKPAALDGGFGDSSTLDAGTAPDGGGSCVDRDLDGYGQGCALGPDCDDVNNTISPAAVDLCDGIDNNCDGSVDEGFVAPSCELSLGVCAGAVATCGPTGLGDCGASEYGAGWEAAESLCDGLDNDCDGTTDEGCDCTEGATQACGSDEGLCTTGIQTCADNVWGACEAETGPMGEVCDGLDNDCDGSADELGDLSPRPCPLQFGVCVGSVRGCGGRPGWIACSGTESYGGDYEQVESLCDGLDNNCDGIVDEGCDCLDGATQPCGTDVGVCAAGVQSCTLGSWGGCAGETSPLDEICNGLDDNCDGGVDEEVTAPCALTEGVCAGSVQRCGGSGGFDSCTAADYSASYELTETRCDGVDNDCDGTTDEGCECVDGATQACGSAVGVCERGLQTCSDGIWGGCAGEITPMGEVCDGVDNDCNGVSDDALVSGAPNCPLQQGVCAGSARECGASLGWLPCVGASNYGADYEAVETRCDGRDNDCDGIADEGCECIDGDTQPCGTSVGACQEGVQTCTLGAWGGCAGEIIATEEICNGLDDDCDGSGDGALIGPSCLLTAGVCAGSTQPCGGAGGFEACAAADYGGRYESVEASCDGFDNDCDGVTDEGCDCVDGRTQPCGSSTGLCERGLQTCGGGAWGDCEGGVEPSAEVCNGLDDNCDGNSDEDNTISPDGLMPPLCPLTEGVCSGASPVCNGVGGWGQCDGSTYGSSYENAETGDVSAGHCDGEDNDCDGVRDEGCPDDLLLEHEGDLAYPHLDGRYLVFSRNFDGNWDVVLMDRLTGVERRLTTTDVHEVYPRVSGDYVVFGRVGADDVVEAILYDLRTDLETALSTRPSSFPRISGHWVTFTERWITDDINVMVHDLRTGVTANVVATGSSTFDQTMPVVRGDGLSYFANDTIISGRFEFAVNYVDLSVLPWTPVAQLLPATLAGSMNLIANEIDYGKIGWSDARELPGDTIPARLDAVDVYGANLVPVSGQATFPNEDLVIDWSQGQVLRDMESGRFIYDETTNISRQIGIYEQSGWIVFRSSFLASQSLPDMNGVELVWMDHRLGIPAFYHRYFPELAVAPSVGALRIDEVLADPAPGADINGDGNADSSEDEFVEVRNLTLEAIDLSGVMLSDLTGVRYTFPEGTVLAAQHVIVVFGGGVVAAPLGGSQALVSSGLGLNNSSETLTLNSSEGTEIDSVSYGSEGNHDESLEWDGSGALVRHSMVVGASAEAQSPGLTPGGFGF